jgi:hypothetical protein
VDFVNIDKNLTNGENMGGLTQTVIFGLWDDVAAWPTAPVAPADIEANAAWVGDVVMKAGKKAFTFYSTDDTAEMQINPVGEVDGLSFEQKLMVFNPGLKKKLLGFLGAVKNEKLFFIPQDNEGQYYLMGDSKRAANMVAGDGVGTGKATADRKGANLTFVFKTNTPRVYVGDVSGLLEVASA